MTSAPSRERPRGLTILGATGSVGRSTLALVAERSELFDVKIVAGGSNAAALARAAIETGAERAVIADPDAHGALKAEIAGSGIEAAAGEEAVIEAAADPRAEMVVAAIVGSAGLAPALAAAERGAVLALANKEALVCAGELLGAAIARGGGALVPMDSEHSAIFQAMRAGRDEEVARLVLTASGGPFRNASLEAMRAATPAAALRHPNWSMGKKISIDSATMMNKALELIEAAMLFDIDESRIDVVVHPQSILHSAVTFRDGSTIGQMSPPDMRGPISYALAWPERLAWEAPQLDWPRLGALDFEPLDAVRFPAIELARRALRAGGVQPMLLSAANEAAVEAFLAGRIGFLDIAAIAEAALDVAPRCDDLDSLLAEEAAARRRAEASIERIERRRAS